MTAVDLAMQWEDCLPRLEKKLGSTNFNTWVRPLQSAAENDRLILYAPNKYVMDTIRTDYLTIFSEVLEDISGQTIAILIRIGGGISEKTATNYPKPAKRNLISYRKLNPLLTFSQHVSGPSNELARNAAIDVSKQPGKLYNPLFIHGTYGVGKTHLMQAVGHVIEEKRRSHRIAFIPGEQFLNDMVNALKARRMTEFKSHYRQLDALLLDDVQFLMDKTQAQEEFFHTFNDLIDFNQQIIITSDRPPKELRALQKRLVTRLCSGLVVKIEPPEKSTRISILKEKSKRFDFTMNEPVANFIADRIRTNVRDLEGALHSIDAIYKFRGRPELDVELARSALKDHLEFHKERHSISNIQTVVAEHFKITLTELKSKRRTRKFARPRQMAMLLAKQYTQHSMSDIADSFGGRIHSTVIHACKKTDELISSDPEIAASYQSIIQKLND